MTAIKLKYAASILIILIHFLCCNQNANLRWQNELMKLIQSKNYFVLRNDYQDQRDQISSRTDLELKAYLWNTFNKNEESNLAIKQLLKEYKSVMSDSTISELLSVKVDNYLKLFDYKSALDANNLNIEKYGSTLDSASIADLHNMNTIYAPLLGAPPQIVTIVEDSEIEIKRDAAGLMNIEVEIDNDSYDFIFDTGAGMSVIKKSFAEELGLKMIETSIDVHSATGKVIKSSLVVIDQLKFGHVRVENSVFLVMEDEMLEFPQIDFYPLAVVGFPVIEELKEFSITKSDTLIINKNPAPSNFCNMRLDGLSPNIYMFNGKDSLEFAFDTGATKSHFTSDYYLRYKTENERIGKADTVTSSSVGGSTTHQTYVLDSVVLFIGEKKAILHDVQVLTAHMKTFENKYGNIGQDLISQSDKMAMNFVDMNIQFE